MGAIEKYIECAGMRLPMNWSVHQLAEALAERKIRLSNEEEVMEAFGDSIVLKYQLEREIQVARAELYELQGEVRLIAKLVLCPNCHQRICESPVILSKNEKGR